MNSIVIVITHQLYFNTHNKNTLFYIYILYGNKLLYLNT